MPPTDNPLPDVLLDYHLGLLDDQQAEQIAHEISRSDRLNAQSRNLTAWLGLLDSFQTSPAPADLVDRILDHVARTPSLRVTEAASSLPPSSRGGVFRHPILSIRELVALAACITFFIGVLVPGFSQMRSRDRRVKCASNLASIFGGLTQYAADHNGSMPQTAGFAPGINWLGTPDVSAPYIPNSRNRYMLVRLRLVKPQNFICVAARGARPMLSGPIERLDDFPARENCSFDSQNMAGPTSPLGAGVCVPIFADRNPLFDGLKLNPAHPAETNSRSHDGGSGQNVLCADGRLLWMSTPVFGPAADNIWQVEGITTYNGTEHQQNPTDAFLVP